MKEIIRTRVFTIPGKLTGELRLTIDERSAPEYSTMFDGGHSTNLALFPVVGINIVRASELDENGNRIRVPVSRNDSIIVTKFTLPIYLNELKQMNEQLKIPEMYSYTGDRLDLNDKLANEVRHVFILGQSTLELIPVVIEKDDQRLEGIKMKFNNERSSVLLTVNELISLIYNLEHLDVDTLTLTIYLNMMRNKSHITGRDDRSSEHEAVDVDIKPIERKAPLKKFDISKLDIMKPDGKKLDFPKLSVGKESAAEKPSKSE